jgi:hypothetical protein
MLGLAHVLFRLFYMPALTRELRMNFSKVAATSNRAWFRRS